MILKMKQYFYSVIFLVLIVSCQQEEDPGPQLQPVLNVYILNQGDENVKGSIDLYNAVDSTYTSDYLSWNSNIERVINFNGALHVLGSNPDQLDVMNGDLNILKTVNNGFNQPFDMALYLTENSSRGYVSNLGSTFLSILNQPPDIDDLQVIDSIDLQYQPGRLLVKNQRLYIAHPEDSLLTIINFNTNITSRVTVPENPVDMTRDNANGLWVLCAAGEIVRFEDIRIAGTLKSANLDQRSKIMTSSSNSMVYFSGKSSGSDSLNTIYTFNPEAPVIETFAKIPEENIFSFFIESSSGQFYIAALKDDNTSVIYRLNREGDIVDIFSGGIRPVSYFSVAGFQ